MPLLEDTTNALQKEWKTRKAWFDSQPVSERWILIAGFVFCLGIILHQIYYHLVFGIPHNPILPILDQLLYGEKRHPSPASEDEWYAWMTDGMLGLFALAVVGYFYQKFFPHKITVRLPDGRVGTINSNEFDPNTMERL